MIFPFSLLLLQAAQCIFRTSIHQIYTNKQSMLNEEFRRALEIFGTSVRDQLSNMLHDSKLPEGIASAEQLAVATISKYGAHKSLGGLHWSTYKAVVRRNGSYSSGTAGQVDMNQALAEPIFRAISVNWDLFFGASLKELLRCHRVSLDQLLQTFSKDFSSEVKVMGVSSERIEGVCKYMREDFSKKATVLFEKVVETLQNSQREVSRVVTPQVQNCMTPAYDGATNESGTGSFERMKALMANFTNTNKSFMFKSASDLLVKGVNDLLITLVKQMMAAHISLLQVLEIHTNVLWEAPADTKRVRLQMLPKIVELQTFIQDAFAQVRQTGGVMEAIEHASKAKETPVKPHQDDDDEFADLQTEKIEENEENEKIEKSEKIEKMEEEGETSNNNSTTTLHPIKEEVRKEGGEIKREVKEEEKERDNIGQRRKEETMKEERRRKEVIDLTHVSIGGRTGTNGQSDVIDLTCGDVDLIDTGYNYDESDDEEEEDEEEEEEEDESDEDGDASDED